MGDGISLICPLGSQTQHLRYTAKAVLSGKFTAIKNIKKIRELSNLKKEKKLNDAPQALRKTIINQTPNKRA
jgi:hypothetical protein